MNNNKYKFSYYLTLVPHKDEYLIAQGINGRFWRMKKNLFDEVSRNLNQDSSSEIEKAKKLLKEYQAIVPEGLDEQDIIKRTFNAETETKKQDCFLNFVLTLRCNFSCPYCFESEKEEDLQKEVIDKALSALFQKAEVVKPLTIHISFYGGEPLLRFDRLAYTVMKAREFCRKNNIKPEFSITTNGSLFTQKVADLFSLEKDLDKVQVTLDGPREVHDKRRVFKGGKGSYDVIMKNLPLMFETAKELIIKINVDKENKNSIPKLLGELARCKTSNLLICPGRVIGGDNTLDRCEYNMLAKNYYEEARKLGLRTSLSERKLLDYRPVFCGASYARPRLIAPDGEMYCCAEVVTDRTLSVGNIFTGYDEEKTGKWLKANVINSKKCMQCRHIFFCGGPCPARVMRGGTGTPFCGDGFKNFLEQNFDKIKETALYIQ